MHWIIKFILELKPVHYAVNNEQHPLQCYETAAYKGNYHKTNTMQTLAIKALWGDAFGIQNGGWISLRKG